MGTDTLKLKLVPETGRQRRNHRRNRYPVGMVLALAVVLLVVQALVAVLGFN